MNEATHERRGRLSRRALATLSLLAILTPGVLVARDDGSRQSESDKQRDEIAKRADDAKPFQPAEVWYRGRRMNNGFGKRPEQGDGGMLDAPAAEQLASDGDLPGDEEANLSPPTPNPLTEAVIPPPNVLRPGAAQFSAAASLSNEEPSGKPGTAPSVLQDAVALDAAPLPSPQIQAWPRRQPIRITAPKAPFWIAPQPSDQDAAVQGEQQVTDSRVSPASAAVVSGQFETRLLEPNTAPQASYPPQPHNGQWAAPLVVASVVAALTTISTMLLITLVITRRFRESVFRVELSNAKMLAYEGPRITTAGQADEETQSAEQDAEEKDSLQPRGVAAELFDLPLEALVEKTYHAEQQEEEEQRQAITESMMLSLFEDNLKLREGIREAE